MPQPQPGNLDHDGSQPWISGLGDALFPMDRSAVPRCGGQPGIGGNLLSVGERAEQALRPEPGGPASGPTPLSASNMAAGAGTPGLACASKASRSASTALTCSIRSSS